MNVCVEGKGGGVTRLVFIVEKRKGNPRCFPLPCFCLVKLNASTQKADGLISAQISEVLFGMLSLHLSGQRPGFTPLAPARSCCCCCRCRCRCRYCSGGSEVEERGPAWRSNKDCEEFKTKCRFIHRNPNERVRHLLEGGLHLLGSTLLTQLLAYHEADSAF